MSDEGQQQPLDSIPLPPATTRPRTRTTITLTPIQTHPLVLPQPVPSRDTQQPAPVVVTPHQSRSILFPESLPPLDPIPTFGVYDPPPDNFSTAIMGTTLSIVTRVEYLDEEEEEENGRRRRNNAGDGDGDDDGDDDEDDDDDDDDDEDMEGDDHNEDPGSGGNGGGSSSSAMEVSAPDQGTSDTEDAIDGDDGSDTDDSLRFQNYSPSVLDYSTSTDHPRGSSHGATQTIGEALTSLARLENAANAANAVTATVDAATADPVAATADAVAANVATAAAAAQELFNGPLYQKLSKLIECPVCLEILRPGTTSLGTCPRGHIVCLDCTCTLLRNPVHKCPVCRSEKLEIVPHNYFAINVIDALTETTYYTCCYPECNENMLGSVLLAHQKNCTDRPMQCPKESCKVSVPYRSFVNGTHPCFTLVEAQKKVLDCGRSFPTVWEFKINLADIFSFDSCLESISDSFSPVLLLPECASLLLKKETESAGSNPKDLKAAEDRQLQHHYKMCFAAEVKKGLMFYIKMLDGKTNLRWQKKQFTVSAHVYTFAGKMGHCAKISPVFCSTEIGRHDQALYLSHGDMYRFAELTSPPPKKTPDSPPYMAHYDPALIKKQPCPSCASGEEPHLHIEIKEYN
jgi:hypothetical protein